MTGLERKRLERGAEHLYRLGARAVAEFLTEVSARIGGGPAMLSTLADFERLTPGQVRAVGGDRFPSQLRAVPGGRA